MFSLKKATEVIIAYTEISINICFGIMVIILLIPIAICGTLVATLLYLNMQWGDYIRKQHPEDH